MERVETLIAIHAEETPGVATRKGTPPRIVVWTIAYRFHVSRKMACDVVHSRVAECICRNLPRQQMIRLRHLRESLAHEFLLSFGRYQVPIGVQLCRNTAECSLDVSCVRVRLKTQ